jgi:hypothetical protein
MSYAVDPRPRYNPLYALEGAGAETFEAAVEKARLWASETHRTVYVHRWDMKRRQWLPCIPVGAGSSPDR